MATTIQVSDETKQLLETMKQQIDALTYDELIKRLLLQHAKIPNSMFGENKKIKQWKKSDRMILREL